MRIGYSFWGFLGPGIIDTPDGGRAHRRPLVDGLRHRGHDIVFLQPDRDRIEAGTDLGRAYAFDAGLPPIDVLFLEWRWPIHGRNTTHCGQPGHTCDLHRQDELLAHYACQGVPTIIWDKDLQLAPDDPWRAESNVQVCEQALHLTAGARHLLCPVDDVLLDTADPACLAARERPLDLGYVGNQYDRDQAFARFFAPAAQHLTHEVAGKWPHTDPWPHVQFTGRIPFPQVHDLYNRSLATVLLLPERYASAGQMTQRIFEALLAGALPLAPDTVLGVRHFVPSQLVVTDATDVVARVKGLRALLGTRQHAELIAECLTYLEPFRLSKQLDMLETILSRTCARSAGAQKMVWS